MTDHYELLGVEPDATKDEIRAAYRGAIEDADTSMRAELNRAWNVLSDPVQRQRYDDALESGGEEAAAQVVPARSGARRGSESSVPEVVDAPPDTAAPARGSPLPPTKPLPEGLVMADVKTRSLAMVFDISILLVIFLAVQFLVPGWVSSDYTSNRDAAQEQTDKAEAAQKREDKANDDADDARAAIRRAERQDDATAEAAARDDLQDAQARASDAKSESKAAEKKRDDFAGKLQGPLLVATLVALVLSLLYTVPMSARTGQTLGKRLRGVRLVREDGSPPGWGASLAHYGVPIVVVLAFSNFLGPLALLFGLGAVLWNIRDRNRQGVHDKLAKTFVVQA